LKRYAYAAKAMKLRQIARPELVAAVAHGPEDALNKQKAYTRKYRGELKYRWARTDSLAAKRKHQENT